MDTFQLIEFVLWTLVADLPLPLLGAGFASADAGQ